VPWRREARAGGSRTNSPVRSCAAQNAALTQLSVGLKDLEIMAQDIGTVCSAAPTAIRCPLLADARAGPRALRQNIKVSNEMLEEVDAKMGAVNAVYATANKKLKHLIQEVRLSLCSAHLCRPPPPPLTRPRRRTRAVPRSGAR
jgi:hypothetical protein